MSEGEATIGAISPFFVVTDVVHAINFYRDRLGFRVVHSEGVPEPFFAILHRDGGMLFVKSQDGVAPAPNPSLHPHLRWDAYCYTPDPAALAEEFAGRGLVAARSLQSTRDGLRGFELTDPDGHVLFFGRPLEPGD
jgi:catechol 2,3-dioxygenase-like lactoylglutathione lyase family enzyme